MKSILLLPFTLFLFFSSADAQTQFDKWHKETIYLHSTGYVKEGKKYRRGFFNQKLKKEFKDSPIAALEFRKSQKNMNTAIILTTLGFASYIFGLDQALKEKEKSTSIFLVGGAVLTLASLPFSIRSSNQVHRAVWMHNGDLLIPKEK